MTANFIRPGGRSVHGGERPPDRATPDRARGVPPSCSFPMGARSLGPAVAGL